MLLYSPFWIINDTAFYIRFSDRVSNRRSLTAGQLECAESQTRAMPSCKPRGLAPKCLTPFLVGSPDPMKASLAERAMQGLAMRGLDTTAHLKVGDGVKWSAAFNTSRVGTRGTVWCAPKNVEDHGRAIGYAIDFPDGIAGRFTKVVRCVLCPVMPCRGMWSVVLPLERVSKEGAAKSRGFLLCPPIPLCFVYVSFLVPN